MISAIKKEYLISEFISKENLLDFLKDRNARRIFVYYGVEAYDNLESNYFDDEKITEEFASIIDYDILYPLLNNTRVIKS